LIVDIAEAVRRVSAGEVVAYPTETVYGLGVDADSGLALERLFALKGRDPAQALSVLVPDLEGLVRLVPDLPDPARALALRFWPGPLTLVLPARPRQLARVASVRGVGFRCSSHLTARALARASDRTLVSTSCNRSGEPPCAKAAEVEACFGPDLPVAVGGEAGGLAPSTVVAVATDGRMELLREGELPYAKLLEELDA
jgi:L-threonylcarbamoyladenylate synthase